MIKSKNYDMQISFILYIDRTTGLEIGYNSSKLFPVLLYPVFFIARFSNARPLLLFFPRAGLQQPGGFLFHFVFEMERKLDEENFFPFLFRPHFLFEGNGERELEEKTVIFVLFFLIFSKEERREVVEKNSCVFLFFLLFEQRENGRIRFIFRFGFSF